MRMEMKTINRLGATFLAVALFATACGDDGEEVREEAGVTKLDEGEGSADAVSASSSAVASASSSAVAVETDSDEPVDSTPGDGGYEYASDVSTHRLVVADICEINELLGAETIDFDAVAAIYATGVNSVKSDGSIRSIGGFAVAEGKSHGLDAYYGTAAPLDEFIASALAGTGMFDGASDAVRKQGVQKGIQNQTMVAWLSHEIRSAVGKAQEGNFDVASGAPHNWDEGWAFYHGSEPACGPYGTGNKRADNFGTLAADGETGLANEAILAAMIAGRDALVAGDADTAIGQALIVEKNITIIYGQAAIRYAAKVEADVAGGDADAAKVHQAEGLAFWRVIEATAAGAGADVDAINAIYSLANEPGANGGEEAVRTALEPLFSALGITAEDIGVLE